MIRNQAKDLELFDNKKRLFNKSLNEIKEESNKITHPLIPSLKPNGKENNTKFDSELEKDINKHKTIKDKQIMDEEFVINIPTNAKKEDLTVLKEFLLQQES